MPIVTRIDFKKQVRPTLRALSTLRVIIPFSLNNSITKIITKLRPGLRIPKSLYIWHYTSNPSETAMEGFDQKLKVTEIFFYMRVMRRVTQFDGTLLFNIHFSTNMTLRITDISYAIVKRTPKTS